MKDEDALQVIESEAIATMDDGDNKVVIDLPSYDDMTNQKVFKSVKDNFDGFDPADGNLDIHFDSTESLARYANDTLDTIDLKSKQLMATNTVMTGAQAARYWCLSRTINAALEKGNYGSNAIDKLAEMMHKGRSRVYQIAGIGKKLTIVDCYLLGMRGVSRTTMERLAGLSDERLRGVLLKGFIEATTNTDPEVLDKRRSAFNAAVKNGTAALDAANAIEAGTSDPTTMDDLDVSPEYDKLRKQVLQWQGYAKKMAGDTSAEALHNALADFFITTSTPDAETWLKSIKEMVAGLQADLIRVYTNIKDLMPELKSLQNVQVTVKEDDISDEDA